MSRLTIGDTVKIKENDLGLAAGLTDVVSDVQGDWVHLNNVGLYPARIVELANTVPSVDTTPPVANKNDKKDGKSPLEYLRMDGIEEMCSVFRFGADKYGKNNYLLGHHVDQLTAAALRHILAYQQGEELDPESGHSHIAHAQCCLAMLQTQKTLKTLRRD